MAVAHLTLFGRFDLRLADGGLLDLPGQKDRALLAILAVSSGGAVSRDKLTGLLWSDRGDIQARDSLKHALKHIRQAFGDAIPDRAGEGLIVTTDRHEVRLAADWISVDVKAFEGLIRKGTPDSLEEANRLVTGEFLDGIIVNDTGFESWLLGERQRLRRLQEQALTKLLAPALDTEIRERAALKLLELDPTREAAARVLMQLHVERGESAQALRLFEGLRDRLQTDLGVKPERETIDLYESIRSGVMGAAETKRTMRGGQQNLLGKPSIAVLPFTNMSNDPDQQYFSDGITEDIITELSRFHELSVLARNASFRFRDQSVDVKAVGRELNAQYIVEGSIRKLGSRIRITVQLIDAQSSNHLWAERYDRDQQEMFVVQDDIVRSLVGTLVGRLEAVGAERSRRKPPASMLAYDYLLRANAQPIGDVAAEAEARRWLEKAIELDPSYGDAQGLLAYLLSQEWFRDIGGTDAVIDRALELAKNSVRLDETNSQCQLHLAWIYLNRQDFDLAEHHYRRALELNPNSAVNLTGMGDLLMFMGRPEEAIEWYKRSRIVDPHFNPTWWWRMLGVAHFVAQRYDEAIAAFNRSAGVPAWAQVYIAASHALAGRLESAQHSAAEALKLSPQFSSKKFAAREPFMRPKDRERLLEGFGKAGLPE